MWKQIENNKIIILTGARQVGKTTLMRKLCETLSVGSVSAVCLREWAFVFLPWNQ
ncbi:MAG: AAA family ATPase [Deltaproteobacteria bacterium]|nr:AAA family ATPase [Deltaproteobacteria bacterium]